MRVRPDAGAAAGAKVGEVLARDVEIVGDQLLPRAAAIVRLASIVDAPQPQPRTSGSRSMVFDSTAPARSPSAIDASSSLRQPHSSSSRASSARSATSCSKVRAAVLSCVVTR